MIQIVEMTSSAATTLALWGIIVFAFILWRAVRTRGMAALALGLLLFEVGRLARIYGPSYMTEPRDGAIRLADDTAVFIFAVHNVLMPLGLVVALVGLGLIVRAKLRESR